MKSIFANVLLFLAITVNPIGIMSSPTAASPSDVRCSVAAPQLNATSDETRNSLVSTNSIVAVKPIITTGLNATSTDCKKTTMLDANDLEPGDWFHRANIWLKHDVNCSPFEYYYFKVKFSRGTWLLLLLDLALHGMLAGVDIHTIILWADAGFVYRAALASLVVCGLAFMLNMSILFVSFAHGYVSQMV
ncbi:hypothetical protein F5883DRAFT_573244, partial [Diaporthe sp. PMI_573]